MATMTDQDASYFDPNNYQYMERNSMMQDNPHD